MTNLRKQDVVPSPQSYSQKSPRKYLEVGRRFGKLVVIDNARRVITGSKRTLNRTACLVRCDCGTEKILANAALLQGTTNSCACGLKERMPDTDWRWISASIRGRAKTRGVEMTLTPLQVKTLGLLPCIYCSHPPDNRFHRVTDLGGGRRSKASEPMLYSGIDRIDSSRGYIPGNVVPCCKFCNFAKKDYTLDYFLERLARYGSKLTRDDVVRVAASLKSPTPASISPNLLS